MEKYQRTKYGKNSSQLRNIIDFAALRPVLADSKLFTNEMLADIEDAGTSDTAKNEELLRRVPKRGPKAHRVFVRSLLDSGQVDAARLLDDLIPDDGIWTGYITNATSLPPKGARIYSMTRRPRGVALIVSNTIFQNDVYQQRFGGEVDEHNLQRLFEQLGFEVDLHQNKSKQDTEHVIDDFQRDERHAKADACIVVVLSHGKQGGFIAADNLMVPNDFVLDMLNNVNCAHLRGKPKIFFFVHCRGDQPDYAVKHQFKRSMADSVPDAGVFNDERSLPTFSDVRICYSTCPDFVSMRCEERGTWFISIFVEICSKSAHDTDLDTILRKVSNRFARLESMCGWKQTPEYSERGWMYPLYFNPGLFD